MLRLSAVPLVASLLSVASASAQGLQGGDFVVIDYGTTTVHRMTAAGAVSVLHQGQPLTSPAGVAVLGNLDVFVSDYSSGSIFRIPRNGAITPFATGLVAPIRIAADRDNSLLCVALTQQALRRVDVAGRVTTVFQGAPLVRPYDVTVDVDGTYLVVDEGGSAGPPALYRVTAGGQITPIWTGSPLRLPHGIALLHDGDFAVIDGIVDAVFRVPRAGGPPTVLVQTPAIINPDSLCTDFEGRMVVAEELASGRQIDLVDGAGSVTPLLRPAPFQNLEAIARAPRLTGPPTGLPAQPAQLGLEFGGEGGSVYLMWATLTVHAGVPLPGSVRRGIPGNPDLLFQISIGANNPVFVGWSGTLSATGTAAPQLVWPNLGLPPLTFHIQALTIDFTSPDVIRSLSNLHVLRI